MPVTDLSPGNEYRFRVFAENVYGRSDASDESTSCQTKGLMKKKQPKTKYEGKDVRLIDWFVYYPILSYHNYDYVALY